MKIIPYGGLEAEPFQSITSEDFIELMLTFNHPVDAGAAALLEQVVNLWLARVSWDRFGNMPKFSHNHFESSFQIGLTGCAEIKEPLKLLLKELSMIPLDLQEILLNKLGGTSPEVKTDALATPNQPEASTTQSDEKPEEPKSLAATYKGKRIMEKRIPLPDLKDCRVAYGTASAKNHISPNKYCHDVAKAINKAMSRHFPGNTPTIQNRKGDLGCVDMLMLNGRIGYAFVVRKQELVVNYSDSFRFKEHELLNAMRDAIKLLSLHPTVNWQRDMHYMINLWEDWSYED